MASLHIDEWTDFEGHELAELALSVAGEVYGDERAAEGQAHLKALEARLTLLRQAPQEGLRPSLLDLLYRELGFCGDWQDYFNSENCDLGSVLARRRGIPVSLGILLIQLGRELGLKVEGLCFPGHFLVCFEEGDQQVYVDPFNGEVLSLHRVELLLRGALGNFATLSGQYLMPASQWEILERLLNVSKAALLREGRMNEALRCCELLLRMKPGDPLETRDRGFIYEQLDCPQFAAGDFEYFIEQCPDDPVADLLKAQLKALDLTPKTLH
ncbi:hypothetical protein G114_08557 [Aeromonas diversa CDC 2478-85]|uniref:Protein SirB1 N-terminal domain-containing protein n=1 Tax=Aeromonas diversa CDC 2478-85 TaxID=1268237 RepID=N9VAL8_9GAMM|nr:tetratricopeptide repeat protein [Aeromonas diversa]ENY72282.1 hypothetical protein G114_08557 [Aeromonas diversa CDC 2478-85]